MYIIKSYRIPLKTDVRPTWYTQIQNRSPSPVLCLSGSTAAPPSGHASEAHAHLLDARDEAVLMSRKGTQESRALSNEESQEEVPRPRLSANAEMVELGPRLEHQSDGHRLDDHDALLRLRHRTGVARPQRAGMEAEVLGLAGAAPRGHLARSFLRAAQRTAAHHFDERESALRKVSMRQ